MSTAGARVLLTVSAILLLADGVRVVRAQSPNCAFLGGGKTVLGNGVTSQATAGSNDPGGSTKLGRETFFADDTQVVGDKVKIGNGSSVDDVLANRVKLGKGVVVRGSTDAVTLPFQEPFCPVDELSCGGQDISVPRGATQMLSPGSYDAIELAQGARLELLPGTYEVCDLDIDKNGTVIGTGGGTTSIRVVDRLTVENGGFLGGAAGGAPLDVQLAGNHKVRFGRNTVIVAFLSAPNARVAIGNGSEVTGAICGERLDVGKGSTLGCAPTPTTTSTSTTSTSSSTLVVTSTSTSATSSSTSTSTTSSTAASCGNGVREGTEQCDEDDFGGITCPGSPNGALLCNPDCTIDFSQCPGSTTTSLPATTSSTTVSTTTTSSSTVLVTTTSTSSTTTSTTPGTCGNGIREGDEQCDQNDFGGVTCTSSPSGSLVCTLECTIDFSNCPGATTTSTVGPTTSTSSSTTLATTTSTSSTTTTTAPGTCGNGIREDDEECDQNDFGGATCAGSPSGSLLCNPDCTIDFSSCPGGTSTTLPETTTSTITPTTSSTSSTVLDTTTSTSSTTTSTSLPETTTSTLASTTTTLVSITTSTLLPITTSTLLPITTSTLLPITTSTLLPISTTTSTSSTTTTTTPTTCGNGVVDDGEECDQDDFAGASCTSPGGAFPEPGSPGGALVCNSDCTIDFTNCEFPTTTTVPGGTTTTTIPGLGTRVVTFANATSADDPSGSHFYTSAINADVSSRNFVGQLTLTAGAPDANGVASLAVGEDSILGFGVVDGSIVCARIVAAGSSGKIDCNGGLAVDMTTTQDSNGIGAPGPLVLQTEQGSPGSAGAGYLVSTVQIVNCGTDTSQPAAPGCSGPSGRALTPSDCSDLGKVSYAQGQSQQLGSTTGTHTAEVTDRRPGSLGGGSIARTGQPFDCSMWETDGPGIVEVGVIAMDNGQAGDIANVVQLDD